MEQIISLDQVDFLTLIFSFIIDSIAGLEPPPPPINTDSTVNPIDDLSQTPTNTKLTIETNSIELTNIDIHSPEQIQPESINLTPPIPPQEESEQV
jgi:hypothetical protein